MVAGSVEVQGGLGRRDDALVPGEAEVAVAGHHQQALAVLVGVRGIPLDGVGDEAVLADGLVLQGPDAVAEVGQLRLQTGPGFGCVHVHLLVVIARRTRNSIGALPSFRTSSSGIRLTPAGRKSDATAGREKDESESRLRAFPICC